MEPKGQRPRHPAQRLPVRIYALGGFRVEVGGKAIPLPVKAHNRPLALLKTLIALGGVGVSIDTLSDAVWPDADGDRVTGAFHTTLHRLRDLVGADVLTVTDGRLSLERAAAWVDCWEFATALQAAERSLFAKRTADSLSALRDALALYRGPFLEGEEGPPPILAARDQLRDALIRHVERVGDALAAGGDAGGALALFTEGLRADELAEPLVHRVLQVCQSLEQYAVGIAAYERFRGCLLARTGGTPGAKLEELCATIRTVSEASPGDLLPPRQHEWPVRVAVLPFANASDTPATQPIREGLVEDLQTYLSGLAPMQVLGRQVAFGYNSKADALRNIAREQGVAYVFDGSVRQVGPKVRIHARLIETLTGREVWAERFDSRIDTIFETQDEIVESIVEEARIRMFEGPDLREWRGHAGDSEAARLTARAWDAWRTEVSREGNDAFGALLRQASARNPSDAYIHSSLALHHIMHVQYGWSSNNARELDLADESLQKAKHLNPGAGPLHTTASWYLMLQRNKFEQSVAEARRGVALLPGRTAGYIALGTSEFRAGLPEQALASGRRAMSLVSSPQPIHYKLVGQALLLLGRPAEALPYFVRSVRAAPRSWGIRASMALCLAALGQKKAAQAQGRELLRLYPDFDVNWFLGDCFSKRREIDTQRFRHWLHIAGLGSATPAMLRIVPGNVRRVAEAD